MDNYFTLPKVCGHLREIGIGILGTARARRDWPPQEILYEAIQKNKKAKPTFNDTFWTVDEHGTLVARWMDNKFVTMVSTIHSIEDVVECNRRRPKLTQDNKAHVEKVWGTQGQ